MGAERGVVEVQQAQIRQQLSFVLEGVLSQTLLPHVDGAGRTLALEVMVPNPAIRNLIREDKVAQMYSAIQTGAAHGMQTMDQCLQSLVSKGLISREIAREKAKMPENF